MMTFTLTTLLAFNIDWDTEGQSRQDCQLPDFIIIQDFPSTSTIQAEQIQILVSDAFGFNLSSLQWEELADKHYTKLGIFQKPNMAYLFAPEYVKL